MAYLLSGVGSIWNPRRKIGGTTRGKMEMVWFAVAEEVPQIPANRRTAARHVAHTPLLTATVLL
jgi:hypothetical protein